MIDTNIFQDKKVAFLTLGCKLNFAETSHLGRTLLERGMRAVADGEEADFCLVNTCSVTELADKKSRQVIRKLHREHPNAKIIVTGCYAQLQPEVVAELEGVDLVLGANEKGDLIKFLEQLESSDSNQDRVHVLHTAVEDIDTFSHSVSSEGRTRHFLKVQDGCDYHCSYCTIPKARGKSRNGLISELVTEAEKVASIGGKEIVLTGVNVGDFGKSTGETFLELIQALDKVAGIERFRISSIEPNLITDEIIRFVADSERFAPHFHIPLQSGSDDVLRLMRRRYKREVFAHKVQLIKDVMPHAFIGVDVIVGTRGERPEYFEDSYQFIEGLPVTKLHVFSYSERPGTDALEIDYVVSPQEKHRRSQRLIELSEEKHRAFNVSQLGSTHKLLLEHADGGPWLYGFTENYVRVRVPYDPILQGEVRNVKLCDLADDEVEVVNGELL
ncbi:tRNA (N(6)-L-threonylcarbamoyladenosine(37)-C(2))-methylthiotransferase MtaB [Porphyromonadaceae bacterium W3.11]|nr:tRNA (N(6)-L-threonylcarbamoyladenosine(37)-C(2))-methylthiotransferase MtaB [Porphyromonadaceae bacterium W3.11]